MTDDPSSLAIENLIKQFRAKGVVITRLAGEFSVNYLNGKSDTAVVCETLDAAFSHAERMQNDAPAAAAITASTFRAKRRLSMRPKAVIKRRIKAHNRRLRARAVKEKRDNN